MVGEVEKIKEKVAAKIIFKNYKYILVFFKITVYT